MLISLLISINTAHAREAPEMTDIIDVLLFRPVGLVVTLAGTVTLVATSPFTAFASISPPHDAFERMTGLLIVGPAKFTFDRPLGVYYPDEDGEYRRHY